MTEPPEPKRRQATLPAEVAAKLQNNQTVELDTADFDELGQAGVIVATPNATVALTRTDLEEFDPKIADQPPGAEPKVMVALDDMPNVDATIAELPQQRLGEIAAQREIQTQYVDRISVARMMSPTAPSRYRALIIAIYLVVGASLAMSIYYRLA